MTPAQRGHRDAAQLQHDAKNPFDFKTEPAAHDAWVNAKARVDEFRAKGLDPRGHAPNIPRLCDRDVTKVCNCCASCRTVCWAEGFYGAGERITTTLRGLLRKMIRR